VNKIINSQLQFVVCYQHHHRIYIPAVYRYLPCCVYAMWPCRLIISSASYSR